MDMRIRQAGDKGPPLEIDDIGECAAQIEHLAAAADSEDTAHFDRDSLEGAVVGVGRKHSAVGEDKVRSDGCTHVFVDCSFFDDGGLVAGNCLQRGRAAILRAAEAIVQYTQYCVETARRAYCNTVTSFGLMRSSGRALKRMVLATP